MATHSKLRLRVQAERVQTFNTVLADQIRCKNLH
jgi:hypothetical protein